MQVASFELCRELHTLSGWEDNELWDCTYRGNELRALNRVAMANDRGGFSWHTPAYDLSYLLRKLPPRKDPDFGDEVLYYPGVRMIGEVIYDTHALAGYWDIEDSLWGDWSEVGDTPEDALAKLCIELFREGFLTK